MIDDFADFIDGALPLLAAAPCTFEGSHPCHARSITIIDPVPVPAGAIPALLAAAGPLDSVFATEEVAPRTNMATARMAAASTVYSVGWDISVFMGIPFWSC